MVKSASESKYKESNENFIENTYGDQYRLTYDSISGKDNSLLTQKEQQKILIITDKLVNNNMCKATAYNQFWQDVVTYTIICKGDSWLVEVPRCKSGFYLFRFTNNGNLIKVLELSEGNLLDFYFYTYK